MNCATHPAMNAAAYCRTCGKALCEGCERPIRGTIYCEDCVANSMQGAAGAAKAPTSCAQHPGTAPNSYCRTCGKPVCRECERAVRGVVYCEDCLAGKVQGGAAPNATPGARRSGPSAGLATVLSVFMPFGVAQAYLAQYGRGLIYLATFCVLIWMSENVAPSFGIAIFGFWVFQLIDAVRSAHALAAGVPAPDPFGLDNLLGKKFGPAPVWPQATGPVPSAGNTPPTSPMAFAAREAPPPVGREEEFRRSRIPTSAIVLIALGVIFLLGHSGITRMFWMGSLWPLIFIAIGVALLVRHWEAITVRRSGLMAPAVMLTLGALFLVQTIGHVRFGRSFPLLLIVIGGVLVWQRSGGRTPQPSPCVPYAPPTTAQTATQPVPESPARPESEVKGS